MIFGRYNELDNELVHNYGIRGFKTNIHTTAGFKKPIVAYYPHHNNPMIHPHEHLHYPMDYGLGLHAYELYHKNDVL